jgi:hypothetical protein
MVTGAGEHDVILREARRDCLLNSSIFLPTGAEAGEDFLRRVCRVAGWRNGVLIYRQNRSLWHGKVCVFVSIGWVTLRWWVRWIVGGIGRVRICFVYLPVSWVGRGGRWRWNSCGGAVPVLERCISWVRICWGNWMWRCLVRFLWGVCRRGVRGIFLGLCGRLPLTPYCGGMLSTGIVRASVFVLLWFLLSVRRLLSRWRWGGGWRFFGRSGPAVIVVGSNPFPRCRLIHCNALLGLRILSLSLPIYLGIWYVRLICSFSLHFQLGFSIFQPGIRGVDFRRVGWIKTRIVRGEWKG